MVYPVLVQDQDHYSAVLDSYTNPTVSAPIKVMIPALGDGWHFFWQRDPYGQSDAGVRGGAVPSEWESIRFWIQSSLAGATIFEESTLAGRLVGQEWSGHRVIISIHCDGWPVISHLEIKRKSQSSKISLAALPRNGIGYIGEPNSSANQVQSADTSADIHRYQFPNDVKFVFSPSNLVLWGNVEALSNTSPYSKTLFECGFAESTPANGKNQSKKSGKKVERDFDDSDDETDDFILARDANQSSSTSTPHSDLTFRLVEISEAAYTTYHAVLCWIHTGNIVFVPLRSSFRLQPNSTALRNAQLTKLQISPSYPLPASLKSVYRLAHFLELRDLAKLAFDNVQSQLTKEIITIDEGDYRLRSIWRCCCDIR